MFKNLIKLEKPRSLIHHLEERLKWDKKLSGNGRRNENMRYFQMKKKNNNRDDPDGFKHCSYDSMKVAKQFFSR